jgi:hypothetical protein
MTNPNESYSDRMLRCMHELLAIEPNPERLIDELESFAIFDECDRDDLAAIFDQCIRSDSDIDEMTALLDDYADS